MHKNSVPMLIYQMKKTEVNFAQIGILPEPELLVIFFCMSLKNPRVGIFFIFSPHPRS